MDVEEITYAIIGAAMRVHNEIGPGLRKKPYENALCHDLDLEHFDFQQQPRFPIVYREKPVGDCIPDIVVADQIVVEVKAIDSIGDNEIGQVLNYLRIANLKVGLIVNFRNSKLEWKRVAR